ncbi:hypothetical protein D3C81_1378130 [compost metagenome]
MLANHLIAAAFRHQTKHLSFPTGQRIVVAGYEFHARFTDRGIFRNRSGLAQVFHPAQLLNQFARHLRMNERIALRYRPNRINQGFRLHVLQQVTRSAFAQRFKHVTFIIMDR